LYRFINSLIQPQVAEDTGAQSILNGENLQLAAEPAAELLDWQPCAEEQLAEAA
jgi:hypothetical protein